MRALWRRSLAPLLMAGAILSAGATPLLAEAAHASVPLAECPAGTNWDHILQTCH